MSASITESKSPVRVLHILPALAPNGAERLLQKLVAGAPRSERHSIAYMLEGGGVDLEGVGATHLGMRRRLSFATPFQFRSAAKKLRALAADLQPDIVQGWLYYGNLMTHALAPDGPAIVWTIHNTTLAPLCVNPAIHIADRIGAHRSAREPRCIVYCAESARRVHERRGYDRRRGRVIANGVDLTAFAPVSSSARRAARAKLDIAAGEKTIGVVARFDRQKNIGLALAAIARLRDDDRRVRVLLCGAGMSVTEPELMAMLAAHDLERTALVLGVQQNMPEIYAGLDLVVLSSSFGEAMPMALLEALCVGVPIAATRVGDVERLPAPPSAFARANDRDDLARAIAVGLTAGPQAPEWVRAFEETRKAYSFERFSAAHSAMYQELMTGPVSAWRRSSS